jgi:hypothetical protein
MNEGRREPFGSRLLHVPRRTTPSPYSWPDSRRKGSEIQNWKIRIVRRKEQNTEKERPENTHPSRQECAPLAPLAAWARRVSHPKNLKDGSEFNGWATPPVPCQHLCKWRNVGTKSQWRRDSFSAKCVFPWRLMCWQRGPRNAQQGPCSEPFAEIPVAPIL